MGLCVHLHNICMCASCMHTNEQAACTRTASKPASQQASKQPDINSRIHACILSVHDGYAHTHGQRESERYMLTYYPVPMCAYIYRSYIICLDLCNCLPIYLPSYLSIYLSVCIYIYTYDAYSMRLYLYLTPHVYMHRVLKHPLEGERCVCFQPLGLVNRLAA